MFFTHLPHSVETFFLIEIVKISFRVYNVKRWIKKNLILISINKYFLKKLNYKHIIIVPKTVSLLILQKRKEKCNETDSLHRQQSIFNCRNHKGFLIVNLFNYILLF